MDWLGLVLICFVLPGVLSWLIGLGCRKLGLDQRGRPDPGYLSLWGIYLHQKTYTKKMLCFYTNLTNEIGAKPKKFPSFGQNA